MEVLKQISPVVVPLAPKEIPEKQRPSSRARIAVVGTGREVMYLRRGMEQKIQDNFRSLDLLTLGLQLAGISSVFNHGMHGIHGERQHRRLGN
jgi:hypothetical protein